MFRRVKQRVVFGLQRRVLEDTATRHAELLRVLDRQRTLVGIGILSSRSLPVQTALPDARLRVHSQFGDDGIVHHLLQHVPVARDVFVEIGVEDYQESNTRFLLETSNWQGVIIDAEPDHLDLVDRWGLLGAHDLKAEQATVTQENVADLLHRLGLTGDIGLLSLDIDGVDYWVLDAALRVTSPRIIIVEYNAVLGAERPVSVPYRADFQRTAAHHSNLYFGASIAAFAYLAERHGYRLVGSNDAGNNVYLVRLDVAGDLPSPGTDCWMESRFRESRDSDGRNTYVGPHHERRRLIEGLELVDVVTEEVIRVGDLP